MDAPPVCNVVKSPACFAFFTNSMYSSADLTFPKPAYASQTPFFFNSKKSLSVKPGSIITEPAYTVIPPGL